MRKQHEKPIIIKDQKQCTQCKTFKPFAEFHKYSKSPDGYKHFCKVCVREYDLAEDDPKRVMPRKKKGKLVHCRRCEQYLDKSNFWGDKETYCRECKKYVGINNNLKNKNLTMEKYSELEKSQNGVCKICGGTDYKRLSVDHDHACCPGEKTCGNCTRGLLCSRCNRTLGSINDSVDILEQMIKYLKKV
jgi:hypothetical protein